MKVILMLYFRCGALENVLLCSANLELLSNTDL